MSAEPPARVTLYFCPACGRLMTGLRTYGLDERRSKCTKTIHCAVAVPVDYQRIAHGE